MATTNVTLTQVRDGLVNGIGAIWTGGTITYSVPGPGAAWVVGYQSGEPFNANYSTFNVTQAANFRAALELWDSYIGVSMNEVADSTPGQIRGAFTNVTAIQNDPNVAAYAYYPPTGAESAVNGDIWVDESYVGDNFAPTTFGYELLLHEMGHALGLKHPFEMPTLPAAFESKTYSIMSYSSEDRFFTWSGGGGSISYSVTDTIDFTPMVLDIAAVQSMYGADLTTATGNNTYAFTDTGLNGRQSIYDAGGIDTIDLSALSRGSNVDLRPGAYSDIAYYNVEAQIADLTAQYGGGFSSFIRDSLTGGSKPAYEWERNVGIAFSTVIENVIGSGQADVIIGNDAANRIDGGGGADNMAGGLGGDTYIVSQAGDTVTEANVTGFDTVESSVNFALGGQYIERLVLTGTGNITGNGNSLANQIYGNVGTNILGGGAGEDLLNSGGGADTMYGGTGSDIYQANSTDTIIEYAAQGYDKVYFYAGTNFVLQAGTEIESMEMANFTATTAVNLTGNEFGQNIAGNFGNNTIDGRGGSDSMYGLAGNDIYGVDNLGDRVYEENVAGYDTVYSSVDFAIGGQYIEALVLTGTGNITGNGNSLANSITGNSGNNVIGGGGGNDSINGGLGNDTLYGGADNDFFFFMTALGPSNIDTIADYNVADDTIMLDNAIFTALGLGTGALSGAAFLASAAGVATNTSQRIIYDTDGGQLYYDADGSGGGAAIQFARLATGLAVTSADFIVI